MNSEAHISIIIRVGGSTPEILKKMREHIHVSQEIIDQVIDTLICDDDCPFENHVPMCRVCLETHDECIGEVL